MRSTGGVRFGAPPVVCTITGRAVTFPSARKYVVYSSSDVAPLGGIAIIASGASASAWRAYSSISEASRPCTPSTSAGFFPRAAFASNFHAVHPLVFREMRDAARSLRPYETVHAGSIAEIHFADEIVPIHRAALRERRREDHERPSHRFARSGHGALCCRGQRPQAGERGGRKLQTIATAVQRVHGFLRNRINSSPKRSRASRLTRCPAPGTVTSLAPAMSLTSRFAPSVTCGRSRSPTMTSVGTLMSAKRAIAGGDNGRTGLVRYVHSFALLVTRSSTVASALGSLRSRMIGVSAQSFAARSGSPAPAACITGCIHGNGGSFMPLGAGPASTRRVTRSGCSSAKSSAVLAPADNPTSAARRTSSASSTLRRSSLVEYGSVGAADLPWPRRS